jgi:hypothetical protein
VAAVGWWRGGGDGVVARSIWGEFGSSESPMYTRVHPHIADQTNERKKNRCSNASDRGSDGDNYARGFTVGIYFFLLDAQIF